MFLVILTAKAMLMKMNIFSAVQSPLAQPMVAEVAVMQRAWSVPSSGAPVCQH